MMSLATVGTPQITKERPAETQKLSVGEGRYIPFEIGRMLGHQTAEIPALSTRPFDGAVLCFQIFEQGKKSNFAIQHCY